MRSIRIIANANNKELRTLHIYAGVTGPTGQFERCSQVGPTGVTGGQIATVQGLTGPTAGVKSIIVVGYTGPA